MRLIMLLPVLIVACVVIYIHIKVPEITEDEFFEE